MMTASSVENGLRTPLIFPCCLSVCLSVLDVEFETNRNMRIGAIASGIWQLGHRRAERCLITIFSRSEKAFVRSFRIALGEGLHGMIGLSMNARKFC